MTYITDIVFDERNVNWCENVKANLIYIRQTERYINSVLKARGHMYLNSIYELLEAKWDVTSNNVLFLYEGDCKDIITFKLFVNKRNGSILIRIMK